MEKEGKFSVVIPAYNREKTVGRAINSVLSQTYQNLQIIIVNDGSTDNTESVIKSYLYDERIKYIYQENEGAQSARNKGLAQSCGEYIIFLDSDDELLPTCLEKVVNVFMTSYDIGAVYFVAGVNKNGELVPMRKNTLSGRVYAEVLEQGFLTSSSFISIRKNLFDTIGEWDVSFPASQDDDMCFRIAKNSRIELIDEILGIYYFDAGEGKQISSSPLRVAKGWWLLWNKYEDEVNRLCGERVTRKHYIKCAYRYKKCNELEMYKKCKTKIKKYSNSIVYLVSILKIDLMLVRDILKHILLRIFVTIIKRA